MTDDLDLICTIRDDANLITKTLLHQKDVTGSTLRKLTDLEIHELQSAQRILEGIGADLQDQS